MDGIGKGIGDMIVFLAALAALCVPTAIGAVIGLIVAAMGFVAAGAIVGAIGSFAGLVCLVFVLKAA